MILIHQIFYWSYIKENNQYDLDGIRHCAFCKPNNSLWTSDTIWHHRTESTSAWVMAWCRHQANTSSNVDSFRARLCGIHLGQFHRKCSWYLTLIWVWKLLIKDYKIQYRPVLSKVLTIGALYIHSDIPLSQLMWWEFRKSYHRKITHAIDVIYENVMQITELLSYICVIPTYIDDSQ